MFADSDLLPISALQHWAFCPRQCALIHLEGLWAENRFTAEGRTMHQRTHDGPCETRGQIVIVRGLRLRSLALGLTGVADVVEFHRIDPATGPDPPATVTLPGRHGQWRACPIEYKRGKPKTGHCDDVQLCAQAMCLEEMLHGHIPVGALFYGRTRRRKEVYFDETLRNLTAQTASDVHALLTTTETPPAEPGAKCENCSLASRCLPDQTTGRRSVAAYLHRALAAVMSDETGNHCHEAP